MTIGLFAIVLNACKPEPKGELGSSSDKLTGMNGTWKINYFAQQDLNNPILEERDLSEFYVVDGVEPTSITFNTSNMSYNVVEGAGRNYFGTSGTWDFDNRNYPSYLILRSETDTMTFSLGSVVRPFDNSLELQLPRPCDSGTGTVTETVIYKFKFARN
jgi:hypothetical protein